jgi:hypothetical protein
VIKTNSLFDVLQRLKSCFRQQQKLNIERFYISNTLVVNQYIQKFENIILTAENINTRILSNRDLLAQPKKINSKIINSS